jgi:hypothetical protein
MIGQWLGFFGYVALLVFFAWILLADDTIPVIGGRRDPDASARTGRTSAGSSTGSGAGTRAEDDP